MSSYSYNTIEPNLCQNSAFGLSSDYQTLTREPAKRESNINPFYPDEQKKEFITSIDHYMNRRMSPAITQFRQYFNEKGCISTLYRKHIETINIAGNNGSAQHTWTISDGDILCNMYIELPWNELGSVVLNYGGSEILNMQFSELYQLYRLYREKSNSIDLIKFLLINEKGICICRKDLSLKINYHKSNFNFDIQVEYANLSELERKKFISKPLEIVLYQYEKIYESNISTEHPISDIYHIYNKNDIIPMIKFNKQLLYASESPLHRLDPSKTDFDIMYFSTKLNNCRAPETDMWSHILPKGTYQIEGLKESSCLIIKYVTILFINSSDTFIRNRLKYGSSKEAEYEYNIQKYKNSENNNNETLPITYFYDNAFNSHYDENKTYWEGKWFGPTICHFNFPVPLPTNIPVDPQFLKCLSKLLSQSQFDIDYMPSINLSRSINYQGLSGTFAHDNMMENTIIKCAFTDKPIENINNFDHKKIYSFTHKSIKYSFYGTLLHDYCVLNIQPSEQFYKAVIERSKYIKDKFGKTSD